MLIKKMKLLVVGILCMFACIVNVNASSYTCSLGGSGPVNEAGVMVCKLREVRDAVYGFSAGKELLSEVECRMYLDRTGSNFLRYNFIDGCVYLASESVTIKFDENYSGGAINTKIVLVGTRLMDILPYAPTRNGYKFLGWYDKKSGGNNVTTNADYRVSSDKEYYAHWEKEEDDTYTKCIVNYDENGGNTTNGEDSEEYESLNGYCYLTKSDLNIHKVSKSNYKFGGWGKTKYCTEGIGSLTAEAGAETTLYACLYTNLKLTIRYEESTGSKTKTIDNIRKSINENAIVYIPEVDEEFERTDNDGVKYKYVFNGWKKISGNINIVNWHSVSMSSTGEIKAIYKKAKIMDSNPTTPPSNEVSPTPVTPTPKPDNPDPGTPTPDPGTPTPDPGTPTPQEYNIVYVTKPSLFELYYIEYNLDGGKFIDGTTSRREIVRSNKPIGAFKTNPIKSGYKFDKWVLSNSKEVDFDNNPSEYKSLMNNNVLTLKATWVKDSSSKDFTCPSGYNVFEPTSGYCYKVLKVDDSTPDNDPKNTSKTYNWTRHIYPKGSRYCYNYFTGKCASGVTNVSTCSPYNNNIFVAKGSNYTTYEDAINNAYSGIGCYSLLNGFTSTNNGKDDAKYDGYPKQDWWKTENTCKFGTACKEASENTSTSTCYMEYKAIIYDRKKATPVPEVEEVNVVPISNSNKDKDNTNNNTNDKNNEKTDNTILEILESPGTGDVLFIIALIIGIGALGYTAYYFISGYRLKKKNN